MDLSGLQTQATNYNTALSDLMNSDDFDVSDPDDQLAMQQALAKQQEAYGLLSAIIASLKTTVMSIIQKM